MKESTLRAKLEDIFRKDKPKSIKVDGKQYYISRKRLNQCRKEGGILPLLTLIPLIAGGVGAAGAVAGGAAGIAKAVHDKNAQDAELAEERRHNREMEKAVGRGYYDDEGKYIPNPYLGKGIKEHVKNFLEATDFKDDAKKAVKKFFKNMSDTIQITPTKEGNGLILNPVGNGLVLNPWKK